MNTAREAFGEEVKIWVFGSRANPTKKEGDIDLYLETKEGYRVEKVVRFLAKLYVRIGERRIDVILEKEGSTSEIAVEAKTRGIRLW